MSRRIGLATGAFLLCLPLALAQAPNRIEFNRHIRPILSDNCFLCHGPDNHLRKAKLRLDQPDDLYVDRGGYRILVPGHPEKSELYRRITAERRQMPPKRSKKSLTKEQIALIRQWIEQGAEFQPHWSFIAVKRPPLPKVKNEAWIRTPVDRFILKRLESEGVSPSEEADRRTLIRRLSFDLTGLPPTPEQVDRFLRDDSPRAYEKLVERLLASPHYGERMALYWLDVVRYADTGGYHSDNHRDIWLYRDYVIDAFNKNKPFDQFVIEQLAGDLLPNATRETKIASGFNRLLQTTEEGGAQPKEYAAKYMADRVRNTGGIFLGLTLGCAECHDHKFDPISTKEFYQFEAFFADLQERPVGRQPQTPLPTPEQEAKLKEYDARINAVQKQLNALTNAADLKQWEEQIRKNGYKGVPGPIAAILKQAEARRNSKQRQQLLAYFQSQHPKLKTVRSELDRLRRERDQLKRSIPTSLISISGKPRTIRVLPRGNWLDDSGEIVQPNVPQSILPLKTSKKRPDRLDLAYWMVDERNPLTARVFVNRLWMLFFGHGIVRTVDDFGSQGAWPSHPDLLDWLAAEFRESGWDVKHVIRLMVNSSTYRQTSKVRPDLKKRDPNNDLFARQDRFRLEAEMVRDTALAISGLLERKIGGPSVKPYQPAGYWKHLNFPKRKWVPDRGPNQYRRGLYTYWQRTFLHPSLLAFDAPTREECTPQRPRSNTPQQALVLLNDPTYVEAARVFAEKVLRQGGPDFVARLDFAFRRALARKPDADERALLQKLFAKHLNEYRKDPKAAGALISVGFYPVAKDLPAAELAAWTSVTRVILNLHETITRQ